MPTWTVIDDLPELTRIPVGTVQAGMHNVIVTLDDDDRKLTLAFSPFQGLKITTTDCFMIPDDMNLVHRTIMEVHNSEWLAELSAGLAITDETATFRGKSRHFLIPVYDNYIEIAAWNIRFEDRQ